MTFKQVAEKFDCSKDLISRVLREHGIDDIAEHAAQELGMDCMTYYKFCRQSTTIDHATILTKTGRPCYVVMTYDEYVRRDKC